MKQHTIKLHKGQFISDVEPYGTTGIPTNSFNHKEVPACGFTHFLIRYAKHHGIGLLPNVPVIKSKVKEHNELHPDEKILGVYSGITVNHIKAYLASDVKYKKILTTPEGFVDKVLNAFKDIEEAYQTFFLLYDECDRIVTDVSYRGAMTAPFDTFFKFKNKALVSATTLPFSHTLLKDFDQYLIEPQYDYSKDLKLITTNNVIESFKKHIDELKSDRYCIFFNSTNGIHAITKNLDIVDESIAFCADESVAKLFENDFKNATDEFEVEDMVKYNFFTSRYFSAIDIKLPYLADVIIVTDVYFADHSIIDPYTEAIQIAGRFRNGIASLTHITNFNPDIKAKTEFEARNYLEGYFDAYDGFVRDYENASNPGKRDSLKRAILDSWAQTFYTYGEVNPFMVDNYIHEEKVKGYYQHSDKLIAAYQERSKHFNLTCQDEVYQLEDKDLYDLYKGTTKKEKYKIVSDLLYNYKKKTGSTLVFQPTTMVNKLRERFPEVADAVDYLERDILISTDYVLSKMKIEVDKVKSKREIERVANFVYKSFEPDSEYSSVEVKSLIQRSFTEADATMKKTLQSVYLFFDGGRTTKKGNNTYVLKDRIYQFNND